MNTVLLETKQDYIDCCIENDIVSYHIRYGSHPSIDNAKTCNPLIQVLSKNTYIEKEPLRYPCIFAYTLDSEGDAYGAFIYPQDFKLMKRYEDK